MSDPVWIELDKVPDDNLFPPFVESLKLLNNQDDSNSTPLTNDGQSGKIKDVDLEYACNECRATDPSRCRCTGKSGFDETAERDKILNGTYPSRIIDGRQRKHIEGTKEFEQLRERMQRVSPGSEPAILNHGIDAQKLVDEYKGKGEIRETSGSIYPREIVETDGIIGRTWVITMRKYVDTKNFAIAYSSDGTHIFPVSEYER
jgi:hypothetical protein